MHARPSAATNAGDKAEIVGASVQRLTQELTTPIREESKEPKRTAAYLPIVILSRVTPVDNRDSSVSASRSRTDTNAAKVPADMLTTTSRPAGKKLYAIESLVETPDTSISSTIPWEFQALNRADADADEGIDDAKRIAAFPLSEGEYSTNASIRPSRNIASASLGEMRMLDEMDADASQSSERLSAAATTKFSDDVVWASSAHFPKSSMNGTIAAAGNRVFIMIRALEKKQRSSFIVMVITVFRFMLRPPAF